MDPAVSLTTKVAQQGGGSPLLLLLVGLLCHAVIYTIIMLRRRRGVVPARVEKHTKALMHEIDAAGDDFLEDEEEAAEEDTVGAGPKKQHGEDKPVEGPMADKQVTGIEGGYELKFGEFRSAPGKPEDGELVKQVRSDAPDAKPAKPQATVGKRAQPKAERTTKRSHITVEIALTIKAKLGLLKRTEANYLLAQRAGRKAMEERGMRPSHIATFLPKAVELSFIPSRADIEAQQMRATGTALARDDDMNRKWQHEERRGWVWSILRPGLPVLSK